MLGGRGPVRWLWDSVSLHSHQAADTARLLANMDETWLWRGAVFACRLSVLCMTATERRTVKYEGVGDVVADHQRRAPSREVFNDCGRAVVAR